MDTIFTKGYAADGAIGSRRIAAWAGPGQVKQAAAATDKLVGVTGLTNADAGGVVDIHRLGIGQVQLGGAVALGDEITANAAGMGITLDGAGESIGRAEQDGVADDIINVFLRPLTVSA